MLKFIFCNNINGVLYIIVNLLMKGGCIAVHTSYRKVNDKILSSISNLFSFYCILLIKAFF